MDSLPKDSLKCIEGLSVGEKLFVREIQDSGDKKLALVKNCNEAEETQIVGYFPGFLVEDLAEILNQGNLCVSVEAINLPPAPLQFRLLCGVTFTQYTNIRPFTNEIYQTIV